MKKKRESHLTQNCSFTLKFILFDILQKPNKTKNKKKTREFETDPLNTVILLSIEPDDVKGDPHLIGVGILFGVGK